MFSITKQQLASAHVTVTALMALLMYTSLVVFFTQNGAWDASVQSLTQLMIIALFTYIGTSFATVIGAGVTAGGLALLYSLGRDVSFGDVVHELDVSSGWRKLVVWLPDTPGVLRAA